jgi:hypothetical protein
MSRSEVWSVRIDINAQEQHATFSFNVILKTEAARLSQMLIYFDHLDGATS